MDPLPLLYAHPAAFLALSIGGAAAMIAWRLRETRRPVTLPRIVAPPLGMSTGLTMFLAPAARVPWAWAAGAFAVGAALLAVPVARASRLVRRGDAVFLERSRAFLWILVGVVATRFLLRSCVERVVSPVQTGSLAFLLAFGMIVRWEGGDAARLPSPGRAAAPVHGPA